MKMIFKLLLANVLILPSFLTLRAEDPPKTSFAPVVAKEPYSRAA